MTSGPKKTWDPHVDLIARFAEAGCAPVESRAGYFKMCCSSPHHGLGDDYAALWRETLDAAVTRAKAAGAWVDLPAVLEQFRGEATRRRREAGDPAADRFGDSKADRSMTAKLHAKVVGPGRPPKNEVGLRCWTRSCSTDDMLAGIGILDKRYLYQADCWTRPETVRPLIAVPNVLLRDDREGDGLFRAPDLSLDRLADAKRLPITFLKDYAEDGRGGGVAIFYRTPDGFVGVKKRLRLAGPNNFQWFGRRDGSGAAHEISAYGEMHLRNGRAIGRFEGGSLIVVEGESDTWALHYNGFPALGLPGKSTDRTLLPRHLEGVTTVFVSRENDGGHGDEFVDRVARRLVTLGYEGAARTLVMPDGIKDPSDLHVADPAAFVPRFREALGRAAIIDLGAVARDMAGHVDPGDSLGDRRGGVRVGWLSGDGVSLSDRGARMALAPLEAASDERLVAARHIRDQLAVSAVARLTRDIEAVEQQTPAQKEGAIEFAHRVLSWAGEQSAASFWTEVGGRPGRLMVAAVERSPDIRSFAAGAASHLPIVRKALELAVIEGSPACREWAYSLRWSAFERLEEHFSRLAAAEPERAADIRRAGELVKQVLRREGDAVFWVNTRSLSGADLVARATTALRAPASASAARRGAGTSVDGTDAKGSVGGKDNGVEL